MSRDLLETQQDALVKLIDFRRLLFARLEEVLMLSGRRFQDSAARCLKEDLPTSVLGLSTSTFKDFLKLY